MVGGLFCLVTLAQRRPFGHAATATLATFGDARREQAFEQAWRTEPRYRCWQRTITATYGVGMVAGGIPRAWILSTADNLTAGVDTSNVIGLATTGVLVLAGAVLVQPAKKIIERLLGE